VWRGGGNGGGDVEETGSAAGGEGQEAVAGRGEGFDQVAVVVAEGGAEGGVDGEIDLTGDTGGEPDALEFSVLKADKEGAV
jgi:hypothetical protein